MSQWECFITCLLLAQLNLAVYFAEHQWFNLFVAGIGVGIGINFLRRERATHAR